MNAEELVRTNVKETKKEIEIMQAFLNGKIIEVKNKNENDDWIEASGPCWNWDKYEYRIKGTWLDDKIKETSGGNESWANGVRYGVREFAEELIKQIETRRTSRTIFDEIWIDTIINVCKELGANL